ncbi:hypothetical protein I4J05_09255 [Corynebacterium diphtheriae bv. mitis]|uniref:hypothetical protein n=1 Tax=Corynebacterium diphtheriae TaxID=1717 RepID=UPI0013CDABC1|nr:hypothetical protein [Corynebacterium diphtheriae]MBG9275254.1 hypothetical protein [Corynebacterium diphtheriae bv. mitis]CAB0523129.1 hypothetical protein CIP103987_01902 [Corynebacterium diphtheriae]CAB0568180.1 hypothetical protein CIP107526_01957 [Corynebacterium diphtheriae]
MAKDGTNRGGRRVRAGAKPDPLNEKLAAGRPAWAEGKRSTSSSAAWLVEFAGY